MRWLALFTLALAGCPGAFQGGSGGECAADSDCYGAEVCSNLHRCYDEDQLERVSVHWTIDGQPASATNCASSPQLDLTLEGGAGDSTFSPVPCSPGGFPFTRLPSDFTGVRLTGESNGVTGEGDIPFGGGDVNIDLGFGSSAFDAGSAPIDAQ
jgi:hypothetical protein